MFLFPIISVNLFRYLTLFMGTVFIALCPRAVTATKQMLHLRLCRWCLPLPKRLILAAPSVRCSLLRHPQPGIGWIPPLPTPGALPTHSHHLNLTSFREVKSFFFSSTANWNRMFRCINTFVPGCSTWFLGSGLSHRIFSKCVDFADALLDHYQNYWPGFRHLYYSYNIKSHSPYVRVNTR